jgi:Transposase, Mutator family
MALEESAMTDPLAALRAGGGLAVVCEALGLVLQALIDAEATQHIGADRYERTDTRTAHRNGARLRLLSTRPATGSCASQAARGLVLPGAAGARRRIDRALGAVVMEAYVHGTSTRKSTTWSRPWASSRDLHVRGQPDLCRAGRRGGGGSLPLPGPHRFPVCVPGRDLPQGPRGRRVVSRRW